ncbi:MAG: hypothetical protein H6618_03585 [Deltaproteobacteria bacterium]|nr:hypothetical protein [Deltaproteobacteria bacterium]
MSFYISFFLIVSSCKPLQPEENKSLKSEGQLRPDESPDMDYVDDQKGPEIPVEEPVFSAGPRSHPTAIVFMTIPDPGPMPEDGKAPQIATDHPDNPIEYSQSLELTQLPREASQTRYLDSKSLNHIYSRVFYPEEKAIETSDGTVIFRTWLPGCAQAKTPTYCQSQIFTLDEASAMNTTDLNTNIASFRENTTINLDYLYALRSALGRQCRRLSTIEYNAQLAGEDKDYLYIQRVNQPEPDDFVNFMKRLLGIYGSDVSFNFDASYYHKAFIEYIESNKDSENKKLNYINAYTATCIALGSHPYIIMY